MGHKNVEMSMIYVHPPEKTLARAVADIDSRSFGHNVTKKKATRSIRVASKELKTNQM